MIKLKKPVLYLKDRDIALNRMQNDDDTYLRKDLEYGRSYSYTFKKTTKNVEII